MCPVGNSARETELIPRTWEQPLLYVFENIWSMVIGREPLIVSLKCDDHILNNSSILDLSIVSLVYRLMREVCMCQNPIDARLKRMSPLITISFITMNKYFFTQ